MKNAYVIKAARICSKGQNSELSFALVHFIDGIYNIEAYFKDSSFHSLADGDEWLTLIGQTDKGLDIEIQGLGYTGYTSHNLKATFICHQFIKVTSNNESEFDQNGPNTWKGDNIFQVELEGLEMQFSDYTESKKYRSIDNEQSFSNTEFDHTSCGMKINIPGILGNFYHLLFYRSSKNTNIILDFRFHDGYNRLTLEGWRYIRHDFVMLLSFLNGGRVFIRKEFCGRFYTDREGDVVDAQEIVLYSRDEPPAKRVKRDFIPINYHHSYSGDVFGHVFSHCFESYHNLNKILDLNDVVFSLNNAGTAHGLKEKYYILIAAFEMICNNYHKSEKTRTYWLDEELFRSLVKPALLDVIANMKDKIASNAMEVFTSKISNLNAITGTADKMFKFLEHARIPLNDNVKRFVTIERHKAVHEGSIGENSDEMVKNYWKLDHILRDSILNLIGYKSHRHKVFKYDEAN